MPNPKAKRRLTGTRPKAGTSTLTIKADLMYRHTASPIYTSSSLLRRWPHGFDRLRGRRFRGGGGCFRFQGNAFFGGKICKRLVGERLLLCLLHLDAAGIHRVAGHAGAACG